MNNLLNNWLVQLVVGNIAWILICKLTKYFFNYFKDLNNYNTNYKNTSEKLYPKELLEKQFNISLKVSSISTITLLVILANNLQDKIPYLFILLIVINLFCYLFMLGAFEGATKYFDK